MNHHCPPYWLTGILFLLCLTTMTPVQAQIVRDTTLPNPSVVTPKGNVNVITGGTQKGVNLFHSFQQFSIPSGKAASFQHSSEIDNIISRATGSSGSKINGLLEVLESNGNPSSANFFLINPNGVLFGPNASLNIGGSFVASTASSIKFAGDSEFSATTPNPPPPSLTVNVPLGLQFGKRPGRIVSEAQNFDADGFVTSLAVQPRKTLALVGGEIDLVGGALGARDGRIELGSVAGGPGLVSLTPTSTGFALGYEGIKNFQDITLSGFALVDVSGNAGGDTAITTEKLLVQDGSQIVSIASRNGRGGTLTVNAADTVELIGILDVYPSGLLSVVEKEGVGGNLVISTRQLTIRDGAQISSKTEGPGQGGDLTVNAEDIELSGTAGGFVSGLFATTGGKGDAGSLTITTQRLVVDRGAGVSTLTDGAGQGGNLTVTASESLTVLGTSLSDIKISDIEKSDIENIGYSGLFAQTFSTGPAGQLKITTGQLRVLDGAQISSITFSGGPAGPMQVQASKVELAGVALSDDGQVIPSNENPFIPSGLLASADRDSTGKGGTLTLETQQLSLRDGAVLQASTLGSGDAGDVIIRGLNSSAADSIEVVGTVKGGLNPTSIQAVSGGLPGSSFFGVPEATGKGGNLSITTNNLTVRDRAQIAVGSLNSTSAAKGAGNVTVTAPAISLDNGGITAATASGQGGNIELQVQDLLLLQNNSPISTSAGVASKGGDGGDITIDTSNIVAIGNSDITANAYTGKGGNILITTEADFRSSDSDITASSELGIDGVVEINTPDVDPSEGLATLPTEPVNAEIAQDCQAGSGKGTSRFISSGSGGLPTNPYEPLGSSDILAEVQPPAQWADEADTGTRRHGDTGTRGHGDTGTSPRQRMPLHRVSSSAQATPPNQIVEAQGWSTNKKGEVVLVAEVPQGPSERGCRLH